MILAGSTTYSIKYFIGNSIDQKAFRHFGETKGRYFQIAFYIGTYIFLNYKLSETKIIDINYLLNPREK